MISYVAKLYDSQNLSHLTVTNIVHMCTHISNPSFYMNPYRCNTNISARHRAGGCRQSLQKKSCTLKCERYIQLRSQIKFHMVTYNNIIRAYASDYKEL